MSKDKGRRARDAAAEFAQDARESAEEAFDSVMEAAEDGLDEAHAFLKRHWEERPVVVAATALGIGLIIGLLLGGRRR